MYRVLLLGIVVIAGVLACMEGASSHPVHPGNAYPPGNYYVPLYAAPSHPPTHAAPTAPGAVAPVPPAAIYVVPVPVPYAYPDAGRIYARPANCGEYRYWDGNECVDARDYPPRLGRY